MTLSFLTDDAEPFVKRDRQAGRLRECSRGANLAALAVTVIKEYVSK
jgi:hypothetical protein